MDKVYPDLFKYGTNDWKSNATTRKVQAMQNFLDYLSKDEKYQILQDEINELDKIIGNDQRHYVYPFRKIKKIFEDEIKRMEEDARA